MAKHNRKAIQRSSKDGLDHYTEESIDDSFLPSADELSKLKDLDPDIIEWIKTRTAKEQNFRHDFHNKQLNIIEKSERHDHSVNKIGLVCSTTIFIVGTLISGLLIYRGHVLTGTIFSGFILLSVISLFMSKIKINSRNNNNHHNRQPKTTPEM